MKSRSFPLPLTLSLCQVTFTCFSVQQSYTVYGVESTPTSPSFSLFLVKTLWANPLIHHHGRDSVLGVSPSVKPSCFSAQPLMTQMLRTLLGV